MLDKKLRSIGYAASGIMIAWREEHNFRLEVACGVLAIGLGLFLGLSPIEWLFIIVCIGTVLSAEAFNTALEELCDMMSTSHDPHIGKIKDLSAAAVFAVSLMSLVVGAIIFIPPLLALI